MTFQRIVFVYNIESGIGGAFIDWARRTFSLRTHPCALRRITHGPFGVRGSWSRYLRKLDTPKRVLARDAFRSAYPKQIAQDFPNGVRFPAIFGETNGKLQTLASPEEISACTSIADLKDLVTERMLKA